MYPETRESYKIIFPFNSCPQRRTTNTEIQGPYTENPELSKEGVDASNENIEHVIQEGGKGE